MNFKKIRSIIILGLAIMGMLFNSCRDEAYLSSDDATLVFSIDTLMFDTIFTSIGSTTKSFRVINTHNRPLLISSIKLAGGNESAYRLNIDGNMTNEIEDIEIQAKDSIYIFVELTVDPNGYNQPMIVQDSVIFNFNSKQQDLDLIAWGQDFVPINNEIITTTTWTAEKPYLVYNYALVDSGQVLTIEPGARVYFHKGASMYVLGAVNATGNATNPILFAGDRLELMYEDIPDQWYGIILFPGEMINNFENVNIRNSAIGLQVGTVEYDGSAYARLHNVKIEHVSYAGILAFKSQIEASNVLISNCGFYGAALLLGGSYDFNHCTIANYWGDYSVRKTQSLSVSNRLLIQQNGDSIELVGDLHKCLWRNSIVWGAIENEIEFGQNENYLFNVEFDHVLYRLSDSTNQVHVEKFKNSVRNEDPLFVDYDAYDYRLDSISPAKNIGSFEFANQVPIDLNGISRIEDKMPDLGVYEWIQEETDE